MKNLLLVVLLCLSQAASAISPLAFATEVKYPVYGMDYFVGTGALSGNWSNVVNSWSRSSGAASPGNSAGAFNLSTYTAAPLPATQWASIVIPTAPASTAPGVAIRWTNGSGGYVCYLNFLGSNGWVIAKINSTASNTDLTSGGTNFGSTDVMLCTAVGTTISIYKNGTLLGSTTDATFSSGIAGIWDFTDGGDTISNFLCGAIQ